MTALRIRTIKKCISCRERKALEGLLDEQFPDNSPNGINEICSWDEVKLSNCHINGTKSQNFNTGEKCINTPCNKNNLLSSHNKRITFVNPNKPSVYKDNLLPYSTKYRHPSFNLFWNNNHCSFINSKIFTPEICKNKESNSFKFLNPIIQNQSKLNFFTSKATKILDSKINSNVYICSVKNSRRTTKVFPSIITFNNLINKKSSPSFSLNLKEEETKQNSLINQGYINSKNQKKKLHFFTDQTPRHLLFNNIM